MQRTFRERLKEINYLGSVIFIPAEICLLFSLQWSGVRYPWNSPLLIGLLSGFEIILLIWIYSQYRLGDRATIHSQLFLQ